MQHSFRFSLAIFLFFIAIGCSRQQEQTPAAAPAAQPAAIPAAASGEPPLNPGFGSHHHPITTSNPEAQKFFDQGFALVFGFNHEEAVRSFQLAAKLDPQAAMPHWGIAWALGPNYNLDIDDPRARQATDAMKTAQALAEKATPSERDYIAAMAGRYSADPKADRAA